MKPEFHFDTEVRFCPRCGRALTVLKTIRREITTLHIGGFTAHETIRHCGHCTGDTVYRSEELRSLVFPGCNFGHDVMVYAGYSLFLRHRTIEETLVELTSYGVNISASGIRELAFRFIACLGIVHAEISTDLSDYFKLNGGFILHLDSSCSGGSSHLVTGIEELSGMVLLNAIIPTENSNDVTSFLERIKARFGIPLGVGSDMSAANLSAIEKVFPDTEIFICHFHFLRDIGKDLMSDDYDLLRRRLRHYGVKAELKRCLKPLIPEMERHSDLINKLLENVSSGQFDLFRKIPHTAILGMLISSMLEAENQGEGRGFPFDLPHLYFFRQLETGLAGLEAFSRSFTLDRNIKKQIKHLIGILRRVTTDKTTLRATEQLELKNPVFLRLRRAFRITEPGNGKGLNDQGEDTDINDIAARVGQFSKNISEDPKLMKRKDFSGLIKQIDKYHDKLFHSPVKVIRDGEETLIQPQRTNNIAEQFFRNLNRNWRRRTGNRITAKFFNRLSPDMPLVKNLENLQYMEMILRGEKSLEERFAMIAPDKIRKIRETYCVNSGIFNKGAKKSLKKITCPLDVVMGLMKANMNGNT